MKYLSFLLLFIPLFSQGQQVVVLHVHQPPELGFELTVQDTTIVRGDTITLGSGLIVSGGTGDYSFQWSPAETLNDSSLMHPLAYPDDTTIYSLSVVDSCGCSFAVSYTVNVQKYATPAQTISGKPALRAILYPNPNNGQFKVKLSGEAQRKITLAITDIAGRMIRRQTVGDFSGTHTEIIDIDLPDGMYNLLIESGVEKISRRFIIN